MGEPKEFKGLFKDLFDKLYYTNIPTMEFGETEKAYKMFCRGYRNVFDEWVETQWSYLNVKKSVQQGFLPYLLMTNKSSSTPLQYGPVYLNPSLELEPRHRACSKRKLGVSGQPSLLFLREYCDNYDKEMPFNSKLWIYLYNHPKRVELARKMLAHAVNPDYPPNYFSDNICQQEHFLMSPNNDPANDVINTIWGLKGKTKLPFPSRWEHYFNDGFLYRNWKLLLNGNTTYQNYPSEIGCPCFYKEFIEVKKTFPFPRSINLKYPGKVVTDAYDEWKTSNFHIKIFAMDKTTETTSKELQAFFSKHYLSFKHYLEENEREDCLSYYFCGVGSYYQIFNSAFVFNEYYRIYDLARTSPVGDLHTMWRDVAPFALIGEGKKVTVNDLIDISYYRPNHEYSKWFRYLRSVWMTTFSLYNQEFWLDRITSLGFVPANFKNEGDIIVPTTEPVDTDSVEWWEYTVYHFIREYPINNVVYPDFVNRIKMEWNAPKHFEDLDAFDKQLSDWETSASNPFWTACAHQWDIYIAWIELNIMSGLNIDGYKQPMASLGKDDRDLEIINIYPNIGVLQDDTDASTWSILKVPGTITWVATFIFGGSWLAKISAYIKKVFITCLKALKEIAIAGIELAKEAGKTVVSFVDDFLSGGKGYILMLAGGAILFLGLLGATEKKIKNIF